MSRRDLKKFLSVENLKVRLFCLFRLFVTPWTVACQAPLSMEFSRQEYWSGLLFPSPVRCHSEVMGYENITNYSCSLGFKNAFRLISSVQKQSKRSLLTVLNSVCSFFFVSILLNPGILTLVPDFLFP